MCGCSLVTQYNSSLSSLVPNFRILTQVVAEKSLTKIFPLERKKNEQIKGLISNMWLFSCYTIQLITIKPCTKFQNPNPSSCWEIFDEKKSLQTNKQTDRQTYLQKRQKLYTPYILRTGGINMFSKTGVYCGNSKYQLEFELQLFIARIYWARKQFEKQLNPSLQNDRVRVVKSMSTPH